MVEERQKRKVSVQGSGEKGLRVRKLQRKRKLLSGGLTRWREMMVVCVMKDRERVTVKDTRR